MARDRAVLQVDPPVRVVLNPSLGCFLTVTLEERWLHRGATGLAGEIGLNKACNGNNDPRSVKEADAIISAVAKANVRLMVAHNHIFNELVEKAKSLIEGGLIGKVHLVKAHSLSWFLFAADDFRKSKAQTGGGVFIDTGAHLVYILQHLLGDVISVFAMLANSPRPEMEGEDNAIVCLRFASGCAAEITITYSARLSGWSLGFPGGWEQVITFLGDRGAIRLNLVDEKLWVYSVEKTNS